MLDMGNGLTERDIGIHPILRKYYRPMFGLIRMINLNGVARFEMLCIEELTREEYISFPFSLTTCLEILAFAKDTEDFICIIPSLLFN